MRKAIIILLCIISNMYYAQHNNPLKDEIIKSLQNDDLNIQLYYQYYTNTLRACKHKGYTKDRKTILECDLGSAQELEELFRIGMNKGREIIKNPNTDLNKKSVTLEQMTKIVTLAHSLSYMKSKYNIEYAKEQNKDLVNSFCSGMIDAYSDDKAKDRLKDEELKGMLKDGKLEDVFEKFHNTIVESITSILSSSPKWKEAKKGTYYIFK